MKRLQQLLADNKDIRSITDGLQEGLREQLLAGLSGSSRSLFLAALYEQTKRPQLIVVPNLLHAQKVYEDLTSILNKNEVFLFPANELIAAELSISSPELRSQRIETLNYLSTQSGEGIIIAPISGIKKVLPPRSVWKEAQIELNVGDDLDVAGVLERLVSIGYSRTDMVSTPGEFSQRGGILDIYPLTEENPYRIELFDTEIDSIRIFSADDQRSLEKAKRAIISPVSEIILNKTNVSQIAERLEIGLSKSLKKIKNEQAQEQMVQQIEHDIEMLRSGNTFDHITQYMSLAYDKQASLLDYISEQSIVIYDEISRIQEMGEQLDKEEAEYYTTLLGEGKIIHDITLSHSVSSLMGQHRYPHIYLSLFLRHVPQTSPQNIVNISCKQMQDFHGQMNVFKAEVERWKKGKYTVVLIGADEERVKRIERILEDYEVDNSFVHNKDAIRIGSLQIMEGQLQSGFELPMQKIALITEKELFNKRTRKSARRQKMSNAERIKNYSELKPGDYVVHVNHGIGKFIDIETLEINGIHKDYLHIRYQGTDKLYVPVDQIDLIQKYVGSEGKEPKMYKLGGNEWTRVKSKVQSSVQDIADDLIKLYAERETAKGYAFMPDGEMQKDFEASFPYKETEDQLRSITEIKKDMERERPMDRLLCGDVGYGKTEVAIRAVFKAVADGKQVAFLVPTTILAQQHYETMRERFQDFPINIGLLSRFRTRKQQTETIKGLKNGTVDVVIGTHRILSKDIIYHDLGLLVVDEEQRFGVTHKEKIKQLKSNIDVLTLTATPIPRTLHMSMLGVRDLSVIETPPENRFPVQTYVMEYNPMLAREAIEREMARGGQVYYLYNRVEDIERRAEELSMLIPDARIVTAHGKMTEGELESVMYSFLEGEADVLVSTTIIETGVDIPNVNTLIVYDADRMGLSQLYQLRGRVGRSNRVAYAYFTYRQDKVLTEVAERRLQAIKEFTELGSGFKIAMRDLTIRGAGNLLGAEQHGFIDSVGFDLYSQMLKEAVQERKGDINKEAHNLIEIDLKVDAYIPDSYIADGNQKIEMYKRFRGITTSEELDELQEEMLDRFGEFPQEVNYLFKVAEIKVQAIRAGVELIKQTKDEVTIITSEQTSKEIDGHLLFRSASKFGRMVGLGMEANRLKMVLYVKKVPVQDWLNAAFELVTELERNKKVKEKTE